MDPALSVYIHKNTYHNKLRQSQSNGSQVQEGIGPLAPNLPIKLPWGVH